MAGVPLPPSPVSSPPGSAGGGADEPADVVREIVAALAERRWGDVLARMDRVDLVERWEVGTRAMLRSGRWVPAAVLAAEWGIAPPDAADGLSVDDLFIRWLAASSPEARIRAAWGGSPRPSAPRIRRKVLGAVARDEDHVEVAYEEAWDIPPRPPEVRSITLRRTVEGWKALVDHDLLANARWNVAPA